MRFEINCDPMGAVRMTRKSKNVDDAAKRYLSYKSLIAYQLRHHYKGDPLDAAVGVEVRFRMPIPKSLKNKVQPGQLHTKKPDIDNLIKGLFDAVNGLLWVDDNRVASMQVSKVYSDDPGIDLIIEPIGGLVDGQAKAAAPKKKTEQRAARQEKSRKRRNIRERF